MRAVVYHGPGQQAWDEVPDPEIIGDDDVIVRVDAATICGTDLRILQGDVPAVREGRILGHTIDGTQAEYVRVPFAGTSTYRVPGSNSG
jgi:alcohol dehydrogenase